MKVYDVVEEQIKDISADDIVKTTIYDDSCIISIPHGGTWIPASLRPNYSQGRALLADIDLFTQDVHDNSIGTVIAFNLAPYVVNVSRPKKPSNAQDMPKHLQKDPLHTGSLLGGPVLKLEHTEEEKNELLNYYDAFHKTLTDNINKMKEKYGYALIIDGHSLFSLGLKNTPDEGKKRPDFVVGTLDGKSASPEIIETFRSLLKTEAKQYGWTVALNNPYKGGYITQHYSNPLENIHVIQLEVSRVLYMTEGFHEPVQNEFQRIESMKKVKELLKLVYTKTSELKRSK
jgi:N-formylglutamate deformylase